MQPDARRVDRNLHYIRFTTPFGGHGLTVTLLPCDRSGKKTEEEGEEQNKLKKKHQELKKRLTARKKYACARGCCVRCPAIEPCLQTQHFSRAIAAYHSKRGAKHTSAHVTLTGLVSTRGRVF